MNQQKTEPPASWQALPPADRQALRDWTRDKYPQYARNGQGGLVELAEACFDWNRSELKRRADWPGTVRNWVRNTARYDRRDADRERPQMRGTRSNDGPTPARDTFREIVKRLEESK